MMSRFPPVPGLSVNTSPPGVETSLSVVLVLLVADPVPPMGKRNRATSCSEVKPAALVVVAPQERIGNWLFSVALPKLVVATTDTAVSRVRLVPVSSVSAWTPPKASGPGSAGSSKPLGSNVIARSTEPADGVPQVDLYTYRAGGGGGAVQV